MSVATIGGLFKNNSRGEQALQALRDANFPSAQISELADGEDAPEPKKLGNPFTDFFKDHTTTGYEFRDNLSELGMSRADAEYFEDGIARGGALVTVKADSRANEALAILREYGADLGSAQGAAGYEAAAGGATNAHIDDEQRLQLREERLAVEKMRVASGAVRVGKRVVSERQDIDVPVSHDELVIERHKVADGAVGGTIGKDESITVPLSRDEVRVGKQTYVTEEVEIGKKAVSGVEHVSDTVRHEELVVDGDDPKTRESVL